MNKILFFLFCLVCMSAHAVTHQPQGNWFGFLKIGSINYKIYVACNAKTSAVYILNPKANRIDLDTIFFRNDSLYFSRADFYSTFSGIYDQKRDNISGIWITDDH